MIKTMSFLEDKENKTRREEQIFEHISIRLRWFTTMVHNSDMAMSQRVVHVGGDQ